MWPVNFGAGLMALASKSPLGSPLTGGPSMPSKPSKPGSLTRTVIIMAKSGFLFARDRWHRNGFYSSHGALFTVFAFFFIASFFEAKCVKLLAAFLSGKCQSVDGECWDGKYPGVNYPYWWI